MYEAMSGLCKSKDDWIKFFTEGLNDFRTSGEEMFEEMLKLGLIWKKRLN